MGLAQARPNNTKREIQVMIRMGVTTGGGRCTTGGCTSTAVSGTGVTTWGGCCTGIGRYADSCLVMTAGSCCTGRVWSLYWSTRECSAHKSFSALLLYVINYVN